MTEKSVRLVKQYSRQTRRLRFGYIIAFVVLIIMTISNFIVMNLMITNQDKINILTKSVDSQLHRFHRIDEIVLIVLRNVERRQMSATLAHQTQAELILLTAELNNIQKTIKLNFQDYDSFGLSLEDELGILFKEPYQLVNSVDDLITHLKDLTGEDFMLLNRRYSLWTPIILAMGSNSKISRGTQKLQSLLETKSEYNMKALSRVHHSLTIVSVMVIFLEIILIFFPLLNQLNHVHKKIVKNSEKLDYLATTDTLTSLGNRRMFEHTINAILQDSTLRYGISLTLLDLNDFKLINDTSGYIVGDHVLKVIAKRLKNNMPLNSHAFRLSGDEFVLIILSEKDCKFVNQLVTELIDKVFKPINYKNATLLISACAGITYNWINGGSHNIDDMLNNANLALRLAKSQGKGKIATYNDDEIINQKRRQKMSIALQQAIADHSVRAFYQPQFDLTTMQIVGVEALARWIHSDGHIISPNKFIPVIEEYNMQGVLLRHFLSQIKNHHDQLDKSGISITFSINITEKILIDKHAINYFLEILNSDHLPWLHLEILETAVIHRASVHIAENLDRFMQCGVKIALDDFGTGHASLKHLQNFPYDIIKIDKSFITDLNVDYRSNHIVEGIVKIAQGLKKAIVAEGVELESQKEFLRKLGANYGQGFLCSKAVEFDSLLTLLNRQKC